MLVMETPIASLVEVSERDGLDGPHVIKIERNSMISIANVTP